MKTKFKPFQRRPRQALAQAQEGLWETPTPGPAQIRTWNYILLFLSQSWMVIIETNNID